MRRYLHAIVYELDPRPVELLTAALSAWFCVVLLTSTAPTRPQPWWLWSAWCAASSSLKVAGVLATLGRGLPPRWSPWLRRAGAALGFAFWVVLATVLWVTARQGITWGGFVIVAVAQLLVLFRLARKGAV